MSEKTRYQINLIRKDINNFWKLKNPNESVLCHAVSKKPSLIKHIKNAPEIVQRCVICDDIENIKYIKDLNRNLQEELEDYEPQQLIMYGRNIDEDIVFRIISRYPRLIAYLKHPKRDIIKKAIEGDPRSICLLKKESVPEDLQLKAIDFEEEKYHRVSREYIYETVLDKFGPHSDEFYHNVKKLKLKHGITVG